MFGGLGGPWGGQPPPPVIPPPPQHHNATTLFSQPPPWPPLASPPPLVPQHPPVTLSLPLLPAPLPPPAAASLPYPTPAPLPPPSPVLVVNPPTRPVQSTDVLQAALDTVAHAQGHIANLRHQLAPLQPTSSLRGVKRKSLATALTSSKSGSHHLDWTSGWDSEMPPDLLAKCRPLHCQLCDVQATSPVQAKMHYQGKTHDKHVRSYFTSLNKLNNLNSAVAIPQKLGLGGQKGANEEGGSQGRPPGLHCSVCDLAFTSFPQVEQHLASKNHTRLASGLPSVKASSFNKATGRWERSSPTDQEQQPAPSPTPSQPSTSLGSVVASEHNFYCQLCKVGAPSQAQMDMHLNGKNHKAKMKRSMGGVNNGDLAEIEKRVNLKESILAVVAKKSNSSTSC